MTVHDGTPVKHSMRSWSEFTRRYLQQRYLFSWVLAAVVPFLVLRLVFFYEGGVPFSSPLSTPDVKPESLTYRRGRIPYRSHLLRPDVNSPSTHEGPPLIRPDEDAWTTHDAWINHRSPQAPKVPLEAEQTMGSKLPPETHRSPKESFGLPEDNEKEGAAAWFIAEEAKKKKTEDEMEASVKTAKDERETEAKEKQQAEKLMRAAEVKRTADEAEIANRKQLDVEKEKFEEKGKKAQQGRESEEKLTAEEAEIVERKRLDAENEIFAEEARKKTQEARNSEEKREEIEQKRANEENQAEERKIAAESEAEEKTRTQVNHKRAEEPKSVDEAEENKAVEKKEAERTREAENQTTSDERKRHVVGDSAEENVAEKMEAEKKRTEQEKRADEERDAEERKATEEKAAAAAKEAEKKAPEEQTNAEEKKQAEEMMEVVEVEKKEDTGPIEQLTNEQATVAAGECDLFDGAWEYDSDGPLYTNFTCFYIQGDQNCMSNGRPDTEYLHWKWKPRNCDLPRFDPRAFLEAFKGKTIGFVGDSLARNQMQSLLCMLSQVEVPIQIEQSPDDKSVRWLYQQHQVTLAVIWSPFLLKESNDKGFEKSQLILNLDVLDTAWTSVTADFDIIVLSTGQWYFKSVVFLREGEVVGCHYCPGLNVTEIGFYHAYRDGVRQALEKVAREFKGIVVMSTFAISHFEHGPWEKGGDCRRERPLTEEEGGLVPGLHNEMHDIIMDEFRSISHDSNKLNKDVKLEFLDVTKVSLLRADGHPGPYRNHHPYDGRDPSEWVPNDCLHWCLPGPVDTWNQLLVKIVHRHL